MADKNDNKDSIKNFFITLVIAIIAVTFIISGEPILGINSIIRDFGKVKIKNPDGTISIPDDAQVAQNRNNPNLYVGRILNELIQLGKPDRFNQEIANITNSSLNPYEKYSYARYSFENAINRVIAMRNAKNMNITISKNYLINEVGKRNFANEEGDPDFLRMRQNPQALNQYSKQVYDDLIFENFLEDYFYGLPTNNDELLNEYKLDNTKVVLKYVDVGFENIDENSLKEYFKDSENNYSLYKLTRIYCKNRADAERLLKEIQNDYDKFIELGNREKEENKILNIVTDVDFSFLDDFDEAKIKEGIKTLNTKDVLQTVIETSVGGMIVAITEKIDGNLDNARVHNRATEQYRIDKKDELETKAKEFADSIYNELKGRDFDTIAKRRNLNPITTPQIGLLDQNFTNLRLSLDSTDDINFIAKIFKANKDELLEPYKYSDGYIITYISDKISMEESEYENLYEDLLKNYSNRKSTNIEIDYFTKERKKYEIVDNFSYVFNIQDFIKDSGNSNENF
jgi:hypothetical protein